MYPFLRLIWQMFVHRNDPKVNFGETYVTTHICWPWDLDLWWELNNGRTLTLFDMGRLPLGQASGLLKALKQNGWGLTVAGSTPRYRRRIRMFDKITMKSVPVGWDDKFIYIEQSMWLSNGECANHVLIRSAVTSKSGIVAPEKVAAIMGHTGPSPDLGEWIKSWIEAETKRPWPPQH
jgi:acyl-CoA thioesterase FadM